MEQFVLGFQALWRIWCDPVFAGKVEKLLSGKAIGEPDASPTPAAAAPEPARAVAPSPARSEALSLLSVLQREGRLVDFLKEPIASFNDAEIGAAVRPIHKDCGSVIERIFGVESFSAKEEGQPIEIATGYDPTQYRILGNAPGQGAIRGKIAHPGWKATRCEVPVWSGNTESAMVLAPAEIEA